MARIQVAERVSSLGNQVFVFRLANGRTVELEFCPPMSNPEGNASCAVVTLLGKNGKKLQIGVNEPPNEKTMMRSPSLWFVTPEEERKNSQKLKKELDVIKEQLGKHFGPKKRPLK